MSSRRSSITSRQKNGSDVKRNKRFVQDAWYRDKVMAPESDTCDMCGIKFVGGDRIEGHHTFGKQWRKNCKSHERIHVDFRMIKVHYDCHQQAHAGVNTDEATIETLLEIVGDCALSDHLEKAGYV